MTFVTHLSIGSSKVKINKLYYVIIGLKDKVKSRKYNISQLLDSEGSQKV